MHDGRLQENPFIDESEYNFSLPDPIRLPKDRQLNQFFCLPSFSRVQLLVK